MIKRVKYGQKTASNNLDTFHLETDTTVVKMGDTDQTLGEYLQQMAGIRRTITLSGDVTGSATETSAGAFALATEVSDDSHRHSGSTVLLGEADRVVITSGSKTLIVSTVTTTELGYLSGVTSGIQSQLNAKAASNHDHDSVYVPLSAIGAASGVAPLGSDQLVPAAYLPSYVDDIIEGTAANDLLSFTATGESSALTPETGKLYLDTASEKLYRWSGTRYSVVSDTIALGETSSTAYRGDRGKIAYDHSQATHARTDATAVAASVTNGSIQINGADTVVYTHPTGSGNNHVPAGGSSGQILRYSAEGTAIWGAETALSLGDVTGDGNAVTAIQVSGHTVTPVKGATFLTAHPTITCGTDTTSTASPSHGDTFTAVDGVTRDSNGHVTAINTKTVTLPAQYSHPSSGVAANTYGATTAQTPGYGSTFDVPYVTVDAQGHVTAAGTATVQIPASDNTDTKVYVKARGTTKAYLLASTTAPTDSNVAHTAVSELGVYLDTTTGKLVATSFSGNGSALTNLSMDNAASGTLALARGGTGGATAAAARTNLGVLNVIVGGTTAPTGQSTGDLWLEDVS